MTRKPEKQPPETDRDKRPEDGYGEAKKDLGGYIGERDAAGDEENPESLPGGA